MNLQNHWFTRSLNVQINNVGLLRGLAERRS